MTDHLLVRVPDLKINLHIVWVYFKFRVTSYSVRSGTDLLGFLIWLVYLMQRNLCTEINTVPLIVYTSKL